MHDELRVDVCLMSIYHLHSMGQHKSNMNVMDHNWALKPQFGPLGNRKEKACAADINNFVTLHHNSPFPKFLILPFLSEPSITLTRSYIRSSTVALSNNHNTIFITWSVFFFLILSLPFFVYPICSHAPITKSANFEFFFCWILLHRNF